MSLIQLSEHLWAFRDTCNVYILKSGTTSEELHCRSVLFRLLDEHHLMNRAEGQPIRLGDQNAVELGTGRSTAQVVQCWLLQASSTMAVAAKGTVSW